MHYIIIIGIVVVIVLLQVTVCIKTIHKIRVFRSIFAQSSDKYCTKQDRERELVKDISKSNPHDLRVLLRQYGLKEKDFTYEQITYDENQQPIKKSYFSVEQARNELVKRVNVRESIISSYRNVIFEEIVSSINSYLEKNKSKVNDFHLMKDIVDRNCDAVEEEINTQIPVPLYLGLMGTMMGILVGIGYLWLSGDLDALLNPPQGILFTESHIGEMPDQEIGASGAEGIKALLGGVALAMISSILGILLTTVGSMVAKIGKSELGKNKHIFLSWLQANLLPTLSNDAALTLEKMSKNLVVFNDTFSTNTKELREALSLVNQTTEMQKQLLVSVGEINDERLVVQNLELYSALRQNTGEIERLTQFLNHSAEYLNAVRTLNNKLDKSERRALAIENMLNYFEKETSQIDQRKMVIESAVVDVDQQLQKSLYRLGENAQKGLDGFYAVLEQQNRAMESKLNGIQSLVDEMKNLSPIKKGISNFEKAIAEQNKKIETLTKSIEKLAAIKSGGEPPKKESFWQRIRRSK